MTAELAPCGPPTQLSPPRKRASRASDVRLPLDRAPLVANTERLFELLPIAVAGMSASEIDVARLISTSAVPALSLAVVENGAISRVVAAGVRNATTREPVTEHTIFEAASLSKPVVAYAVLQLVDAGVPSLDEPLARHVPDYIPDDPRAATITVRHVLAHMTGLPNWRSDQRPLRTYFTPGEHFSYSGEGFVYLQRVVERIAGEPLDGVVSRLVFAPLGMRDSSFVWQNRFDANYAAPHDDALHPGAKFKPGAANVAYSLQTTAADYARFLQAVLAGVRLEAKTARLWLTPQVNPPQGRYESLEAEVPDRDPAVAWGLGWGLEPELGTFFHWGWNVGANAFAFGSPTRETALVLLTNGDYGTEIVPEIVAAIFPGHRPSLAWLGYEPEGAP